MPNQRDCRDTFVMILVAAGWTAATIFLFLHASATNFATWSGFSATACGAYHWLCVSDDKRADAGNVEAVLPTMVEGAATEDRDWTKPEAYPGEKDARAA